MAVVGDGGGFGAPTVPAVGWERMTTLLAVLPVQFYAGDGGGGLVGPRRLAFELVNDAVGVLSKYPRESVPWGRDRDWIAAEACSPPSFIWCCDVLGWSADAVREAIVRALETRREIDVTRVVVRNALGGLKEPKISVGTTRGHRGRRSRAA